MNITPEQAVALFRKHELFLYPTQPEQLVALLAEHEREVIAGLVERVGADHHDFIAHRAAWRSALQIAHDSAEVAPPDKDDKSYWRHEIEAFERSNPTEAIAALQAKLQAAEARLAALEKQEPVAEVNSYHLKPWEEGKHWCKEVLLYSGNNPGDKSAHGPRVKLYKAAGASPAKPVKRCQYCDGTGDVHTPTGEWRGECTACDASIQKGKQP